MPWQFGPITRMPDSRAVRAISTCAARPSSPASANPDVTMMAKGAPWRRCLQRSRYLRCPDRNQHDIGNFGQGLDVRISAQLAMVW